MTQPNDENPVLVTDRGAVRTVTLNRPAAFNSFDLALKQALLTALADAADPAIRAVVITGAGRAFCAGQDLKEHLALVAADDERVGRTVGDFYNPLVRSLQDLRKPVVAAVNGPAAGAGTGLALARPAPAWPWPATCGSRRHRRPSRWRSRASDSPPTPARPTCCPGSWDRAGPRR